MQLKITDIPDEIIKEYNVQELETLDGYIYCKIRKGMYGLPQAGIIAQNSLPRDWPNMATIKAKLYLDCGHMKQEPPPSHLLLTTLQ